MLHWDHPRPCDFDSKWLLMHPVVRAAVALTRCTNSGSWGELHSKGWAGWSWRCECTDRGAGAGWEYHPAHVLLLLLWEPSVVCPDSACGGDPAAGTLGENHGPIRWRNAPHRLPARTGPHYFPPRPAGRGNSRPEAALAPRKATSTCRLQLPVLCEFVQWGWASYWWT